MITHLQCRAARAWLDLTQSDLAELAGLNKNSIMTWELGKSVMHPNNVAAVERALMERGVDFLSDPPGLRVVA
jgi:transcriptional regulator with XRE-family HTH domain